MNQKVFIDPKERCRREAPVKAAFDTVKRFLKQGAMIFATTVPLLSSCGEDIQEPQIWKNQCTQIPAKCNGVELTTKESYLLNIDIRFEETPTVDSKKNYEILIAEKTGQKIVLRFEGEPNGNELTVHIGCKTGEGCTEFIDSTVMTHDWLETPEMITIATGAKVKLTGLEAIMYGENPEICLQFGFGGINKMGEISYMLTNGVFK